MPPSSQVTGAVDAARARGRGAAALDFAQHGRGHVPPARDEGGEAPRLAADDEQVDVFRARIVDVTNESFIIEVTGDAEKIDGLVEVLRPFGILEMVRTGRVSMARGATPTLVSNGNSGRSIV